MEEDEELYEEKEDDEWFVSGSWESLMMSYGGDRSIMRKMQPIREFMNHFDKD